MSQFLHATIVRQREMLTDLLARSLQRLARRCAALIPDREGLERLLSTELPRLQYCKHLYVLDRDGVQLTANITRDGRDDSHLGRDRSDRPYMQGIVGTTDFRLSEAYISRNQHRPSFTAVQVMRDVEGQRVGFLGVDYDLRELPRSEGLYREPSGWRQIKGDPAIREHVFQQTRAESGMDQHIDAVFALMTELMTEHGIFHGKLHFSSSRAIVWAVDDPFNYRLLDLQDLIDPDICLAYPQRGYTEHACVPEVVIPKVFEGFRQLRFGDDTVYLRSGSLNVCNGMVSLNFSCDGSHYMHYSDFLDHDNEFWRSAE
jgi:hypothetical protein